MKKIVIFLALTCPMWSSVASSLTITKVIGIAIDKRYGNKVYVEFRHNLVANPCQRKNIIALDTNIIADKEMLKDLRIAKEQGTTIYIKGNGSCTTIFNGQTVETGELMKSTNQ